MRVKSHIASIVEGGKATRAVRGLLYALSGAYCLGAQLHRGARSHLLPKTRLDIPVISVGNIVAGGSGKTPFVHHLAQSLAPKKVAILSRGYKRKGSSNLVVETQTSPLDAGDEPKFLKTKLPDSLVIVGKNRSLTGRLAQALKADIILLDDGLQHHCLHRDRDIVTLDTQNLLGGGYLLPRGTLREHPRALGRADLLVLTNVADAGQLGSVTKILRNWASCPIASVSPIFPNRHAIEGKRVGALCAIARPKRFFDTLTALNCTVVDTSVKSDHEPFSLRELCVFAKTSKAKGAQCLVCTEKDAIKWEALSAVSLPVIPLKMEVEPQFGGEHIQSLIQGVLS